MLPSPLGSRTHRWDIAHDPPKPWHFVLIFTCSLGFPVLVFIASILRNADPTPLRPFTSTRRYINPSIANALDAIDAVPIASYDDALETNRDCLSAEAQSSPHQLRADGSWWRTVSHKELLRKRSELTQRIREQFNVTHSEYQAMFGNGRGIVFTAGGSKDTWSRLKTTIAIIREQGCTLPIEVFAFQDELRSAGTKLADISRLGSVIFRRVEMSRKNWFKWKNFQVKGEAVLRSSFTEVLYLDSDNIPVRDVTSLFDSPIYRDGPGVVLWPDITKDGARNVVWRLFGIKCPRQDWQLDSGQILIDKRGQNGGNLVALSMAAEMQRDYGFWFRLSAGDKDTFRYPFYALNLDWTPSPHWLSGAGTIQPPFNKKDENYKFCSVAMIQYGLSTYEWYYPPYNYSRSRPLPADFQHHAPPLFVHANLLKHARGNSPGTTFTHLKRFAYDNVTRENLNKMDNARGKMYVRKDRGMCVEIWDESAVQSYGKDTNPDKWDAGDVVTEDFKKAWGGSLREFEELIYRHGLKPGA